MKHILPLLWLSVVCAGAAGADASLRVEADRQRIYAGESFILSARVNGADAGIETPVFDPNVAADITSLGSRSETLSQVMIINGRVTESRHEG
ncbi:MAG: BatD family protein, partial [Kiritimatiellaeota bacterium]|nr:BatD family protein [Kiritimatiellota bacterium]